MAYNNEYVHKLLKIELFLFPSLPCVCCNSGYQMLLCMLDKMDSNFLQKGNKHLALSPPSCMELYSSLGQKRI